MKVIDGGMTFGDVVPLDITEPEYSINRLHHQVLEHLQEEFGKEIEMEGAIHFKIQNIKDDTTNYNKLYCKIQTIPIYEQYVKTNINDIQGSYNTPRKLTLKERFKIFIKGEF